MQSKDTILSILASAIGIANRLAFTESSKTLPYEHDYKQDIISVLGSMRAVEALVKHDDTIRTDSVNDYENEEVAKINRKLRLWVTRPNQVNATILSSFLRLKHEDSAGMVKLDILKARYRKDCIEKYRDKFKTNFDQMKTISDRNHAKIFDVDSSECVTIWPNAQEAVEEFRKQMNIGK